MSNGGKFKLYTVLNGLIFPTPTQPRISFERPVQKLNLKQSSQTYFDLFVFTLFFGSFFQNIYIDSDFTVAF
jgi:hypothetical protein